MDHEQRTGRAVDELKPGGALYRRVMAGGGYVEIVMESIDASTSRSRGRVIVERRADGERRVGHAPPVVAALEGSDVAELTAELFGLAQDNAALARGVMRWQSARNRAD